MANPDATAASAGSQRFDSFTVLRRLGVGPDGAAVLARGVDGVECELLFLTRLRPGTEAWARAELRLRRAAVLEHPVQRAVLDLLLGGPSPAVQLAWPGGQTLGERLREGPMTRRSVLTAMERLAHGVFSAHRLGLAHGSLAPSAVLVAPDGTPRAQFTGLRVYGADAEDPLDRCCVPPERRGLGTDELALARVDTEGDVYALAALTLCALAGGELFEGAGDEPLRAAAAALGDPAGEVFARALSDDRDARPAASELCLALRELVRAERGARASARPPSLHATMPRAGADASGATLLTLEALAGDGPREVSVGTQLGRFQLVKLLGEGGMGQVFEGVDLADGRSVAVKVLRPELARNELLFKRFKKEARVLDEARSPYVANLLDVNVDRGVHFLALEYVDGGSLQAYLDGLASQRLPEREALELLSDACRALAEPHRRGIVHRDLKPDNLMFARADRGREPGGPRVKVVDFGIARSERDERAEGAVKLTQEGAILGTPHYMAPEQCRAEAATPATDVYALGVLLYQLLAGRCPFESEVPTALLVMHLADEPPALRAFAPDVSDEAAALAARALRKNPAERFADASAMLDEVERLLRGDPGSLALHPALPDEREGTARERSFTVELRATPAQLWPYVADSDRLNRLVGLPAPSFELRGATPYGEAERSASYALNGLAMQWREAPYEWVEGRRWGALRVFDKGPLRWISITVELARTGEGDAARTRVTYTARFVPRAGLLGAVVGLDLQWRHFPRLRRAFTQVDALLTGARKRAPDVDAFGGTERLGASARRRLDASAAQLVAEGRDARVVEHLAAFISGAPEADAARLRPLAFAEQHGLDPDEVVAVCLHAARKGVLTLAWDVLCPLCRVPARFVDSLRAVEEHAGCPACAQDFTLDFASSIELVFAVAPALRRVARRAYCVGGPALFPHVAAQLRLRPGERFALTVALEPGEHRVRVAPLPNPLLVRVRAGASRRRYDLELGARSPAPGDTVDLAPGEQQLVLTNALETECLVRVERMAPKRDALTAARASAMPVFRELFPDEVLAPGQLVSVTSTALLATALPDASALFARLGDAKAFPLLLAHLRAAGDAVHAHGGTVLKTLDAGLLAAFDSPARAVRAALALRATPAASADASAALAAPNVALHHGSVMAATIDQRLDYFGHNVAALHTLLEHAKGGDTVLSRAAFDDPEVAALLAREGYAPAAVALPGWGAALWAVRLGAPTAPAPAREGGS